jgi:hypothetical protein
VQASLSLVISQMKLFYAAKGARTRVEAVVPAAVGVIVGLQSNGRLSDV